MIKFEDVKPGMILVSRVRPDDPEMIVDSIKGDNVHCHQIYKGKKIDGFVMNRKVFSNSHYEIVQALPLEDIESFDTWFDTNEENVKIRIWGDYVWLKKIDETYYGGYKIVKAPEDNLVAHEWIFNYYYR